MVSSMLVWVLLVGAQQAAGEWTVDPAGRQVRFQGAEVGVLTQDLSPVEGGASFASDAARLDVGPDARLGFDSDQSFTVELRLRTTHRGFCTPLMCREGEAVNYSFVMGRTAGTLSFELWSWGREKAVGIRDVCDGEWHDVVGVYDAEARCSALFLDGRLEAVQSIEPDYTATAGPSLRLGNNIGAHQPFPGDLGPVRVAAGAPEDCRALLAEWKRQRLLEPAQVDEQLEAWLVRHRAPRRPEAEDAEEWRRRSTAIAAKVQDSLGLWPPPYDPGRAPKASTPRPLSPRWDPATAPPTDFARYRPELPLDPRRGGSTVVDGVRLTRLAWTAFEGYEATGWLYLPEPEPAPGELLPAILCPHGHWQHGARHPTVQARCWTLARNGFAVLAVDSAHHLDDPIGLSPLSVMIWCDLRGLEFLRSLPFVDPARIGCTGASGGGQQTFYLTALKSGLAAAAPAVMVCYFEEILLSSGVHCYCNFTPQVMRAADEVQMSAAFAPRPQMFFSVTGDWTHAFPRRGFPETHDVYSLFDAGSKTFSSQWAGEHDYHRGMRNEAYAFFQQHLQGVAHPRPNLEPPGQRNLTLAEMQALERGGELAAGPARDFREVAREFRARLRAPSLSEGPQEGKGLDQALDQLQARLRDRFLRLESPAGPCILEDRELGPWLPRGLRIHSEPGFEIPAWLDLPEGPTPAAGHPVALMISTEGARLLRARDEARCAKLKEAGVAVMHADVRYTGELDRAHRWREAYGRIFGLDEAVTAVHDLRRLLDAVEEHPSLDADRVGILADGDHGAAAVYAAAVDDRPCALVVPALGSTYLAGARRPAVSAILRAGDLPDALALAPPTVAVGGIGGGTVRAARAGWDHRHDAEANRFTSPRRLDDAAILRALLVALAP